MAVDQNEMIISGERAAKKGILIIAVLALLNGSIGHFTGIVVLLATSVANIADILTLSASFIGLRISRRRASRDFRFGFYKSETFAALVVAAITIILALQILWQSLQRLFTIPSINNPALGFMSAFLTILASYYLYRMLGRAAKSTNSLALRNNADDKRNDILSGIVVFFGIIASYYHLPYVEGLISMFISLMILHNGYKNGKDSLFFLLDYWNDPKFIEKIRVIVKRNSKIVRQVKQIRLRRAGTFIFGEIYLEIIPFAEIQDVRVEVDNLKKKIMALDPYIKSINIYTILPRPGKIRIAIPIEKNQGLASPVARRFIKSKAILIATVKEKKITHWEVFDFAFKSDNFQGIVDFFAKHKVDVVIDNDMHSLVYCQLIAKSYINIFPHFSNIKDAEGMIKILMINNQ